MMDAAFLKQAKIGLNEWWTPKDKVIIYHYIKNCICMCLSVYLSSICLSIIYHLLEVLEMQAKASPCMLNKCSATTLHPQPLSCMYFWIDNAELSHHAKIKRYTGDTSQNPSLPCYLPPNSFLQKLCSCWFLSTFTSSSVPYFPSLSWRLLQISPYQVSPLNF